MTTDTTLIEKREELKRRLAAGEYKTLVDIFLEKFDRLIRKIIRRPGPFSSWYIGVILYLVIILIGLAAIYVAGDANRIRESFEVIRPGFAVSFLYMISVTILPIASAFVINQYIAKIIVFWRDSILDATESLASLDEFKNWLEIVCNRRLNLFVIIIGGSLGGLYLIYVAQPSGSVFFGYGITFMTILVNLFNWNIVYQLIMVILLSTRLRQYDLKIFAAEPASSELIFRLSNVLSFMVYFVAVFAALLTLTFAFVGLLPFFGGSVVLFYWLPLIALFALNQTSLSSIIRRVKWKTLNEAQAKIEKLRASKNFGSPKTMDAINKLMDYHDRVKATRNSALNSDAILGFINSLLLPLLAFLLGNLDKLMALLPQRP